VGVARHPFMNILIINLHYPPDTGATALIIRDLAEVMAQRHQVTVLAGRPSYEPKERHPYYLSRRQQQGNVTVVRVGTTARHRKRMIGRLSNYLSYMLLAQLRALTLRPKPDVIIAMTDPPLAVVLGAVTSLLRRRPLVYNIRDLHPDMAVASGVVKAGMFTALWERLHRWAMKRARRIVVLGEDMKERITGKGIPGERLAVVRDGADPSATPASLDHPTVRTIRGDFPFVVVHAGNLGFAGTWDALLEAAQLLEPEGVGLTFIGEGAMRASLEEKARGRPNVKFLPYFPAEEVPYVMAAGDLQTVTLRPGLEGLVVPSKLYPILMAGRPVLAVAPEASNLARMVREHQCGLVVEQPSAQQVAEAILWAKVHPQELAEMARRSKQAGKLYDRQALALEFVRAIEDTAASPRGKPVGKVSAPGSTSSPRAAENGSPQAAETGAPRAGKNRSP